MTWIEAIGIAAALLAFYQVGRSVGRRSKGKERKSEEDELVATRLQHVLGSVSITDLDCEPHRVAHGQTISMMFTITSEVDFPFQVWLGASAIDTHGREYWDDKQDKMVFLEKGGHSYRRELTIPSGVPTGNHPLIGAVWLGQKAHPERSIQLDSRRRDDILTIN